MNLQARDTVAVSDELFDVIVIGGGINGAAVAWDLSLRGYRTLLVEKADFGSAASAGCFKIAHGGLRYLQHLDLPRLWESANEQRILRQIAPHFIHPLPFLIPCYGRGMKSRAVLDFALSLYELLACKRNKSVDRYHMLASHAVISSEHCLRIAPGITPYKLRAGVVYYDCQISNCERLTYSVIRSAADAGACMLNYVEATGFETRQAGGAAKAIDAVRLRDLLSGREFRVRAKIVVNAAGPWAANVQDLLGADVVRAVLPRHFSKGFQLVLPQFIAQHAVALESRYREKAALISRGSRSYFCHPWRGRTLIGTSDEYFSAHPDNYRITKDEILTFLKDLREAYRDDVFVSGNVRFVFGGLRPVAVPAARNGAGTAKETEVLTRDLIIDHQSLTGPGKHGLLNFVSAVGVKYTTFRALAEKTGDIVARKLGGCTVPCRTASSPLYGGDIGDYESYLREVLNGYPFLTTDAVRHLIMNYGSKAGAVAQIMHEEPDCASVLSAGGDVYGAELAFAAREGSVCHLDDVVLRRTGLGTLGHPGADALKKAATIVGRELSWDAARQAEEIERTETFFRIG